MRKLITQIIIILIIIITFIPYFSGHAQRTKSSLSAGEQRHAEKGLKDNRYFFYFINSSISNFGTDEEKKLFKTAIQRDIISQLLYMQFLFHDSFVEIKKSQKILIDLYREILKRDISNTKKLLNSFVPNAIKTNDHKARHYLKLGYRDAAVAKIYLVMADNYRERLYSMRLYKYVRAIKKAKHGKRYAFLSIIESTTPHEEKKELGYLNFDEINNKISGVFPEKKDEYSQIHFDNYYKSKNGTKSYYDQIWENPNLEEIKEYKEYLDKR